MVTNSPFVFSTPFTHRLAQVSRSLSVRVFRKFGTKGHLCRLVGIADCPGQLAREGQGREVEKTSESRPYDEETIEHMDAEGECQSARVPQGRSYAS